MASVAPLGSSVAGSSAPSRLGAWLVFLDYRHVQEGFKNIMEMCSEDMEVFFSTTGLPVRTWFDFWRIDRLEV